MLSFFDRSTVMAQPWAKAGYLCYCIDVQHPDGETVDPENENIIRVGANIEDWLPPAEHKVVFAAFFPPCTDLAVSGARWFRDKGIGKLHRAIGLFYRSAQLAELFKCPYIIENPVSTISSYWRKPDYTFHPCHYGNRYLKRTCLWVGGEFIMPPKTPVKPTQGMKLYWLAPSDERANLRSVTPSGFARAVFKANDPANWSRQRIKWGRNVRHRWDNRCAVTGISHPVLTRPVYIKRDLPWRDMPANGILLAPHVHSLFVGGLIAFGDKGEVIWSERISSEVREQLSIPTKLRRRPTKAEQRLFRQHRAAVFS
jgi:hypothetical protein